MKSRHPMNKSIINEYKSKYQFDIASVKRLRNSMIFNTDDNTLFNVVCHEMEGFSTFYVELYNNLIAKFDYDLKEKVYQLDAIALSALQDAKSNWHGIFNMSECSVVTAGGFAYALVIRVAHTVTMETDFAVFADTCTKTQKHIRISDIRIRFE